MNSNSRKINIATLLIKYLDNSTEVLININYFTLISS